MRKVCLDTDFLVALLRRNLEAAKKAEELDFAKAEVSTTSMNAFELYLGAYRSTNVEKNLREADGLLNSVGILPLSRESSKKSSETLARLLRMGEPIGLRDAIIAGITMVEGYVLLTRNVAHFSRVIGLSLEEW